MTSPAHLPGDSAWQIPEHTAAVFRPRASRYAVCLFVINEGERVRAQLRRMAPEAGACDIIIGDGGSRDGSLDEAFLRECGVRALLTKTGPGKLSAQMRMALAWCLREGYEGVVVVDGNDKDDTAALPRFLARLDEGFAHVQGSRYVPGGVAVNTPWMRHWGVTLLHAPLLSLAAGFRYTDTTNGFRAYSRKLLLDPRVAPFRDIFNGYELHYYLAIRAARLDFPVCEIPVTRAYPAEGGIPTKITGWRGNLMILSVLAKACLQRFNPGTGT